jgi:hypothetical protein
VQSYARGFWGLNAADGPDGYAPYGALEGPEDGTVSPTGAISSLTFVPSLALPIVRLLYDTFQNHDFWGRYGFGNAFNVDRNWFDQDVIGIDLGMELLSIENYRSGLVWRLMNSFYGTGPAFRAAGFHLTLEPEPRPLQRVMANPMVG